MSAPPRHGPAGPRCEHRRARYRGHACLPSSGLTGGGAILRKSWRVGGRTPRRPPSTSTRGGLRIGVYAHGATRMGGTGDNR